MLLESRPGNRGRSRLGGFWPKYRIVNRRSARLLLRLGFVKEGVQRAYLLINGEWHDHVSTSLINDAWSLKE